MTRYGERWCVDSVMGQTGSSVVKKVSNWWGSNEDIKNTVGTGKELTVSPFVFTRRGYVY